MDIFTLKTFLIPLKEKMVWDFLLNNSNYDGALCDILWMQVDTCRYWDARWNDHKIEFKKWTSIWLDLVRYSEVVLKTTDDAKYETITLFFIPDKRKTRIQEVFWIKTSTLIAKLGLNHEIAQTLLELHRIMPRSLNAQASLTVKDIRMIADFAI